MFLGVDFPPKLLAEMLCATAHALEVVEVIGRNTFENLTHAAHGEHGESITRTGIVEVAHKEPHEFAPLRRLGFLRGGEVFGKIVANGLHVPSVAN